MNKHKKARIKFERKALREIAALVEEKEFHRAMSEYYAETANNWRSRYEQLTSSPKVKVDTKSAFNRGAEQGRKARIAYLIETPDKEPDQ